MTYDPRAAIPTLVGSALSCFATSCVLISWMCYGQGKRSFRYALVLNLTFAEWVNSLNNTISGAIAVHNQGVLLAGRVCTFNGWIGQLSVQAADFSILAIALVTLLTIKLKSYILHASFDKKILICLSVWLVPLATSTTAVAMQLMQPVSGNWCWIASSDPTLRYALGHGWRFAIIAVTIAIYIYVFVYMRRRLSYLQETSRTYSYDYGRDLHDMSTLANADWKTDIAKSTVDEESIGVTPPPKTYAKVFAVDTGLSAASLPCRRRSVQSRSVEREIWRMLLLNAYPIMYVVLWLPGIVNRIVEATGTQCKWLQILQCSTQYVGLANALTYGFKEHSRDFAAWLHILK